MSTTTAAPNASAKPAAPGGPRKIPAPQALPESLAFWEAADRGRLLIKACLDCGKPHYYPRDICPHCLSAHTEWREAGGFGTVYSYSPMGRGEAAYTLAFVTLDEGVTMMTNLVDCDPAELTIGQRVRAVFKASEGGHAVPMFAPMAPR